MLTVDSCSVFAKRALGVLISRPHIVHHDVRLDDVRQNDVLGVVNAVVQLVEAALILALVAPILEVHRVVIVLRLDLLHLLCAIALLYVRHADVHAEHENVVFAQRIVYVALLVVAEDGAIRKNFGFCSRDVQAASLLH